MKLLPAKVDVSLQLFLLQDHSSKLVLQCLQFVRDLLESSTLFVEFLHLDGQFSLSNLELGFLGRHNLGNSFIDLEIIYNKIL